MTLNGVKSGDIVLFIWGWLDASSLSARVRNLAVSAALSLVCRRRLSRLVPAAVERT